MHCPYECRVSCRLRVPWTWRRGSLSPQFIAEVNSKRTNLSPFTKGYRGLASRMQFDPIYATNPFPGIRHQKTVCRDIWKHLFSFSGTQLTLMLLLLSILRPTKRGTKKKCDTFSICACHPCAGAMLIFSVSFQFLRMTGFDPGSTALAAAMATEVDPPLALNTHLFGAGLRAKEKCVCCAQIL